MEAGYQPESAYFETLHELKLIVDLLYEGGLSWMRYSISDTAEYGDYTRGPRVVTDATRQVLKDILGEIQSGEFAHEWLAEAGEGAPNLLARRAADRSHQIEKVGSELRNMMPFLTPKVPPTVIRSHGHQSPVAMRPRIGRRSPRSSVAGRAAARPGDRLATGTDDSETGDTMDTDV